ncbi:hypothetical protein V6N13_034055 [Hibiscus sabdariffa]|uniref:Uncharacterized protein n=1 Tax=Hibiscus sabdariffa TaxID=183260 RepID=A0ABR2F8N1_9ROSI
MVISKLGLASQTYSQFIKNVDLALEEYLRSIETSHGQLQGSLREAGILMSSDDVWLVFSSLQLVSIVVADMMVSCQKNSPENVSEM